MNDPQYLVVLLERQYLATLLNGLMQREAILKEILKKEKYNVNANNDLPKVKADINEINQLLMGENNVINCYLQRVYKFKFQSVKVQELTDEPEKLEVVK
jgi:hypothetical protein